MTNPHLALTNTSPGLRRSWHPVAFLSDIREHEPRRVELMGEGYVVTKVDGNVSVFLDRCPHRNARLSDGRMVDGNVECPYHGWQFDNHGRCSLIPALGPDATVPPTSHLTKVAVAERYDLLWIAPEDPVCSILDIPEWNDPTLRHLWLPPVDIRASAGQFVDNFLDFGHFPFVHAGTFGAGEDEFIVDYDVEKADDGWGFVVDYPHTIHNNEDPKVATGEHPLVQPRHMRYTFGAPFVVTLRLELPMTGMRNVVVTALQPLDQGTTRVYTAMLRNDCPTDDKAQAAIDYEMAILAEDLKVIEHLWDKTIPLERGQAHTRADRNTVEFRRIMQRLLA